MKNRETKRKMRLISFAAGCVLTFFAGTAVVHAEAAEAQTVSAKLVTGQEFHDQIVSLAPAAEIRAIEKAASRGGVSGTVLSQEGEPSVTAWFENGTVYLYSDADRLKVNEDANHMFEGFSSLVSLDASVFDTSGTTAMHRMFAGCSSLTGLDLSSFDTSSVTNMSMMFTDCSSLASLDVSRFDTSSVTTIYGMFNGCKSLTDLNLISFNTANVTDMNWMFHDCSTLTSLDLSSFDTSHVASMKNMFSGCTNLSSLNLTSFDATNVEASDQMFAGCDSLNAIKFKDIKIFMAFTNK